MVHEIEPSRRVVAAGAAWLVPSVAVAAAAPALAASSGQACEVGDLQVEVRGCATGLMNSGVGVAPAYFRISGPGGCEIPQGTPFTVTLSSEFPLQALQLDSLNSGEPYEFQGLSHVVGGVELTFATTQPWLAGYGMLVRLYNSADFVNGIADGETDEATVSLTVMGASASFSWKSTGFPDDVYLQCL